MYATGTAEHVHNWMKFFQTEPFGDEWRQVGVIAAASQQPHSKKPIKPEQFMPQVAALRPAALSPDALHAKTADYFRQLQASNERHRRT